MAKFLFKRILSVIPTLMIVLIIVFCLVRVLPGSAAYALVDEENMTPEAIAEIEARLGLDKPLWEQFLVYMKDVFTGNWGNSYLNNLSVIRNITSRLEPTIMITICSTIITVLLGIPMGVFAATHRNSWLDYTLSTTALAFRVVPAFWLCAMMVYFISFKTGLFPVQGYKTIEQVGLLKSLHYVALPSIALGLSHVAATARHTRSSMLQVLGEDYVRTAKAKGLSLLKVRYKHALRNTLALIVTTIGTSVAAMLGGSVVVEKVFNIEGIGKLAYDSLLKRDYPQEQAVILFSALVFIGLNIILDILYRWIDPRISFD